MAFFWYNYKNMHYNKINELYKVKVFIMTHNYDYIDFIQTFVFNGKSDLKNNSTFAFGNVARFNFDNYLSDSFFYAMQENAEAYHKEVESSNFDKDEYNREQMERLYLFKQKDGGKILLSVYLPEGEQGRFIVSGTMPKDSFEHFCETWNRVNSDFPINKNIVTECTKEVLNSCRYKDNNGFYLDDLPSLVSAYPTPNRNLVDFEKRTFYENVPVEFVKFTYPDTNHVFLHVASGNKLTTMVDRCSDMYNMEVFHVNKETGTVDGHVVVPVKGLTTEYEHRSTDEKGNDDYRYSADFSYCLKLEGASFSVPNDAFPLKGKLNTERGEVSVLLDKDSFKTFFTNGSKEEILLCSLVTGLEIDAKQLRKATDLSLQNGIDANRVDRLLTHIDVLSLRTDATKEFALSLKASLKLKKVKSIQENLENER